eukprot:scaffold3902_cov430-Prasinococcus_capsulatus_cf.AAC.3
MGGWEVMVPATAAACRTGVAASGPFAEEERAPPTHRAGSPRPGSRAPRPFKDGSLGGRRRSQFRSARGSAARHAAETAGPTSYLGTTPTTSPTPDSPARLRACSPLTPSSGPVSASRARGSASLPRGAMMIVPVTSGAPPPASAA